MRKLGYEPGDPRITCDGCGVVRLVTGRGGMPARWFLDGKAAPGWKMIRVEGEPRADFCPKCDPLAALWGKP